MKMEEKYAISLGSVSAGFTFYGPFDTYKEAQTYYYNMIEGATLFDWSIITIRKDVVN